MSERSTADVEKAIAYYDKAVLNARKNRVVIKLTLAKAKAQGITISDKERDDYIKAHYIN